jgi:hypothetical protein
MTDNSREAFEKWAIKNYCHLEIMRGNGQYESNITQCLWKGWQAAKAASAPLTKAEAAEIVQQAVYDAMFCDSYGEIWQAICALEKHGMKFKENK